MMGERNLAAMAFAWLSGALCESSCYQREKSKKRGFERVKQVHQRCHFPCYVQGGVFRIRFTRLSQH